MGINFNTVLLVFALIVGYPTVKEIATDVRGALSSVGFNGVSLPGLSGLSLPALPSSNGNGGSTYNAGVAQAIRGL